MKTNRIMYHVDEMNRKTREYSSCSDYLYFETLEEVKECAEETRNYLTYKENEETEVSVWKVELDENGNHLESEFIDFLTKDGKWNEEN